MKVKVIGESDLTLALIGLGLSYGLTTNIEYEDLEPYNDHYDLEELRVKLYKIADKLCSKDTGENKFLESIVVWLDITAPRYWWQQFSTYRVGTSTQSESTMHTLMKRPLTKEDFDDVVPEQLLNYINSFIELKMFDELKNILPEGFLQRRIVCTNYKVLRHIYRQRRNHKLKQWKYFLDVLEEELYQAHFITEGMPNG